MAMEKLGATPASPGLIKTPAQMATDLYSTVAHFAKGGSINTFPKHDIPEVKQIQFDLSKLSPVKNYLKAGGRTKKRREIEKYLGAIMASGSSKK